MGGWVPAVKASVPGAEHEEKGGTWPVGIQAGTSFPVGSMPLGHGPPRQQGLRIGG